jgi:hypothetical protein
MRAAAGLRLLQRQIKFDARAEARFARQRHVATPPRETKWVARMKRAMTDLDG